MSKGNNKEEKYRSKSQSEAISLVSKWVFLGIAIIFTLYPIVYTIFGSLKTNAELTLGGHFLPQEWHFENYYRAFVEADFLK